MYIQKESVRGMFLILVYAIFQFQLLAYETRL